MEPSSGKSQKINSGTDFGQSTENDTKLSNSLGVNLSQTPDSRLINDVNIAKITPNSTKELQSNSQIDSCITSLCELQDSLQECEEQIEEQIRAEKMAKNTQEPSEITDNFPVIFAYPSKNRPRQPFMAQPPSQPGRIHPPPSYYSPPVPRPPQQSAGEQHPQSSSAQPSTPTEQPKLTQDTQGRPRPGNFVFVDTLWHPWGSPAFIPATLYSTVVWAPLPSKIPSNIPNCLAHLVVTDSFFIAQITWFDYFTELEEFFLIQNKNGECLYFVYETMDYGEFALCDSYRAYRLHFMDMYQNEVIFMHKLSGTTSCCCCYPEMLVHAPPGTPVGSIIKKYDMSHEEYSILDPDRNKMFRMIGPCCATCCCWTLEADFTIHALDEDQTEVGFIRREAGYVRSYTGSELFGLTLPMDMDVRIKAVFLGKKQMVSHKGMAINASGVDVHLVFAKMHYLMTEKDK